MTAKLCLCAAAAAIGASAFPQDGEWDDAMGRARRAEEQGNYAEAVSQARRAAALADHFKGDDERTWSTYNFLGIAYEETGQYAESIRTYGHTLSLIKGALGTGNLTYAVALNNQGTVYLAAGELKTAVNKLREALRIELSLPEEERARTIETQSRLGEALVAMGQRREAERLIVDALAVLTQKGDCVETAAALNNLGTVRRWQRRFEESIEFVTLATAMLERVYGAEHPLLLRPLNNLAVLYMLADRNGEADAVFRRAQAICEKRLPPGHPSYASLLANYATLLRKTGESARAKAMEQQARSLITENNRRNGLSQTVDVAAFRHP